MTFLLVLSFNRQDQQILFQLTRASVNTGIRFYPCKWESSRRLCMSFLQFVDEGH